MIVHLKGQFVVSVDRQAMLRNKLRRAGDREPTLLVEVVGEDGGPRSAYRVDWEGQGVLGFHEEPRPTGAHVYLTIRGNLTLHTVEDR